MEYLPRPDLLPQKLYISLGVEVWKEEKYVVVVAQI